MVKPPESEKAARYIAQLDEARCSGKWEAVPELCRKVEKHAPHRRCLALTARSEAQISAYSGQRPSTAASTVTNGLSKIIPSLLSAIQEETEYVEDAFQATVCLGWLHYVLEEPGLAVARLPKDFASTISKLASQSGSLGGWTRVCIVKGVFLKGTSQDKSGANEEAIDTYMSIMPWLSSLSALGAEPFLFKSWTERLLVRLCQLVDLCAETGNSVEAPEALLAYRLWAKFWDLTNGGSGANNMGPPRRSAWKAYYCTLSAILLHDLPYVSDATLLRTDAVHASGRANVKFQQRAELKRVETIYEGLLLKETHFPKASDSNRDIENWADAVIANWRVLCGPAWTDEDLGEGGKEAVGRGVLDILYRAAAKTFHSTLILRHLFTVHASLAEFDLAFRAYDSYVEIVTRGKDRAEKSGEEDVGIDDDDLIVRISAEAIRVLCRFGTYKEAEKALEIGHHIEKWLEQTQHIKSTASEVGSIQSYEAIIPPPALAAAYSAIGISQAQWAHFTYNATARTAVQAKAAQYLRRSLEPRFYEPNNVESLYALGLLLAEMRDLPGAIKVVKRALSSQTHSSSASVDNLPSGLQTQFGRERKLIPLWHLLALLLTARSEFTAAEKACEAAFQQFGDLTVLFGAAEEDATYRSEHLNEVNEKRTGGAGKSSGVVDQMGFLEKTEILQLKMTQLALVDVIEGPDAAVEGCDELLSLYTRLFGRDEPVEKKATDSSGKLAVRPKSAVGTIRGSIFRSRGTVKAPTKDTVARNASVASSQPSTVATQTTGAPTIQVTDETGADHARNGQHHHLFHHTHESDRPGVTRTPSKLQKRSANSLRRRAEQGHNIPVEVTDFADRPANGVSVNTSPVRSRSNRRPSVSTSARNSLEADGPHRHANGVQHSRGPSSTTQLSHLTRSLRIAPPPPIQFYIPSDPRFPAIQIRRHRLSLLVDIWLFITNLYTRADMFDDARGALAEALKLVETFEAEVAQECPSSKAFAYRGWGGGKSVEELWADVFCARGEVLSAQSLKHEAKADLERALLHYPDHPQAIVALSNILLDIYAQVIPLELDHETGLQTPQSPPRLPAVSEAKKGTKQGHPASHTPSAENQISPPDLNRIAARDRAFGLLSTLTKLGTGWDYSEAWYALARAYEESGQIEKAKEVLWWCVELEDTHPLRSWRHVALGGFVL
ncbi:filamentation protein-like protein [Sporormia fimetaria CBS 119925]|uniref:Filamentation protein-like protein n=1 Tax=Sporormia fimetaria CBS 119925 TaxID=1340428 RepID=A0A6A6VHK0_9PLEO|nr:filamentation protein-like protein [Sporormia fimetaria CBS 119925]